MFIMRPGEVGQRQSWQGAETSWERAANWKCFHCNYHTDCLARKSTFSSTSITTSHECYGVANHRKLEYLFKNLFEAAIKKSPTTVHSLILSTFAAPQVITKTTPTAPEITTKLASWQLSFTEHESDVTMGSIASQIISLTIVYSNVYSGADQRKHQSSASLAFVRGIHRRPVNSPHKRPVTRKMLPFDDVIMRLQLLPGSCCHHHG